MGRDWVELETPDQAAARESARERRAQLVKRVSAQHPERFRQFAKGDAVTVLAGDPRQTLRGKQCSVVGGPFETSEPDTGVTWSLTYQVRFPGMYGNEEVVEAEHLALEGSKEEAENLAAALPEVWAGILVRRATEKRDRESREAVALAKRARDDEKAAAERAEAIAAIKARDANPRLVARFNHNDPVVIRATDPRPTLRGKVGKVGFADDREVVLDGKAEVVRRSYQVTFADFTMVYVDAEHLDYLGR